MSSMPSGLPSSKASAFNMRYANLSQFRFARQPSQRAQIAIHRAIIGSITNPAKSLDLLRQTLQAEVNIELDKVLSKYISRFFKPALRNIRENEKLSNARAIGNASLIASLNEVILVRVRKQLLEEAAKSYTVQEVSEVADDASDSYSETRSEVSGTSKRRRIDPQSRFDASAHSPAHVRAAQHTNTSYHPYSLQFPNSGRRKRAYDAESIALSECASHQSQSRRSASHLSAPSRSRTRFPVVSPLATSHGQPARPASANPSNFIPERPHSDSNRPASANPQALQSHHPGRPAHGSRPAVTDTSLNEAQAMRAESGRLDETSLFVLGSHANKALGLGAIRGKIYAKHAWLFKYVCDSDDKQWMANEASILHSSGGKAILLLRSDVRRLAETPEYRNVRFDFNTLRSFHVPNWMIQKMRRSAANVPEASAPSPPSEWPQSDRHIAHADSWAANAMSGSHRHQPPETWSATLSERQTPNESRTTADSDDEASHHQPLESANRSSLPFTRIVAAAANTTSHSSGAAGTGYPNVHGFASQNSNSFTSDRQSTYASHTLVTPAHSTLEVDGTYHLVDSDGDAVVGHVVAVEEVVTCQSTENEIENENETHADSSGYFG